MIILVALLIVSGCSNNDNPNQAAVSVEPTVETETTEAATPAADLSTEAPTVEPTAEPYVFDTDSISDNSLNGLLRDYDIPEETTQLILVAIDETNEKLYLMEKQSNGMWEVAHGPFDVQIGKNGLGKEIEGDGKSPEGLFALGYAFGEDEAPTGTTWPWRTTEDGDIWVEDSASEYYNMFIADGSIEEPDWKNYSNLNIAAFERAIEIRYNADREAGAGSAIFLHIWISEKKDTNGCTSVSRENIETLIAWLDPSANTMIAQVEHSLIGDGNLVYLTDFTDDIISDIKFATDDNILGTQIDGYYDNQVITNENVARALIEANDLLSKYGVKLVVYEAYRPVDAFYQIRDWLNDLEDTTGKENYYMDMDKIQIKEEYMEYNSDRLYLRAQVVHVALANLSGEYIDMGGEYMVFDEYCSYICDGLTQEQIFYRELLHDIMIQEGFSSVENQWWKFEYNPYLYGIKFDEVIK